MTHRLIRSALAALVLSLPAAPAFAASHDGAAELIAGWLDVQEEDPGAWGQAWLEQEAADSRYLDQSFYASLKPSEKRAMIDQVLSEEMPNFPDRMQQLSMFQDHWAGDVAAVQQTLAKEFGAVPAVDVYVWFAMSPQKAVACTIDGKPAVAVNARHLLPYQPDATRILLTRALLVHLAAGWARDRQEAAAPPSVAAQLQAEGLTAWAAARVVPNSPLTTLLSVTPVQAAMLERAKGAIARELLNSLDAGSQTQLDRFFSPKPPEGWPPSSGRYLGMLVAQEVAHDLGGAAVVRMSRKAYTERARAILKRLASGAGS
jgi:hypothetical protein